MSTDKRAIEGFRVRQHAGPRRVLAAAAAAAGAPSERAVHPPPAASSMEAVEHDTGRVILHFDADSFYAQVEEVRAWAGMGDERMVLPCRSRHAWAQFQLV